MEKNFWLITGPDRRTQVWRKKAPARKTFIRDVNQLLQGAGQPEVDNLPAAKTALQELQAQNVSGSQFEFSKLEIDEVTMTLMTELASDAFHSGLHYGLQNDDDSEGLLGWEDSDVYAILHG